MAAPPSPGDIPAHSIVDEDPDILLDSTEDEDGAPSSAIDSSLSLTSEQIYSRLDSIDCITVCKMHLYRSDLLRLAPGRWLNDKLINSYMELLVSTYQNTACLSTYAFSMMGQHSVEEAVEWYREADLLSYEYLLIPVHEGNHWTLIIVNGLVIEFYDSLGGINREALRTFRNLLRSMRQQRGEDAAYRIKIVSDRLGRQRNGNDCGVYCCMAAKYRISPSIDWIFTPEETDSLRGRMLHELLAGSIIYDG